MEKVINKFDSFEEAEEAELAFWAAMEPRERLRIGFELLYRRFPEEEFLKTSLKDSVRKFSWAERPPDE